MDLLNGMMVIKNKGPRKQKQKKSSCPLFAIHQDVGIGVFLMMKKKEMRTLGKFWDKKVKIKVDKDGKESFYGREVCKILKFRGIKLTPLRQVKQVYKTDLK